MQGTRDRSQGAGRQDLVWDTDVIYDVANMVVSKYLVWKQSRVSVLGGANRPLGQAVQYVRLQTKAGAVEGAYLAMTPSMTNQLLASCQSNVIPSPILTPGKTELEVVSPLFIASPMLPLYSPCLKSCVSIP